MKRSKKIMAYILALITILSSLAYPAQFCFAAAADNESLDHSSGLAPKAYLSPSDLLSLLVSGKEEVSDAEKQYLDDYFEGYLSYSLSLPSNVINVTKDQDTVNVTAKPHVCTADNGKQIIFLPVKITQGSKEHTLSPSGENYTSSFTSDGTDIITVYYNGSIALPLEYANTLINFTYEQIKDAKASSEDMKKYGEALVEYNHYLAALEKYESDTARYEAYLTAKALYDEAMTVYEQYLKDQKKYESDLLLYTQYENDLNKYVSDMERYKADYAIYEKNQADYKVFLTAQSDIRTAMNAMESIYVKPSNDVPSLYDTLQNQELVTMFDKYSGVLVTSFGVKQKDIDILKRDSNRLNVLLQQYAAQRKISDEAAFIFYKQNYKEISTLFNSLYARMDSILNPTIFNLVCGKLELEYKDEAERKKWRLKNVLAHIYLVCLCLDDKKTAESTWSFYRDDGDPTIYYFSDLLAQEIIIPDTNSSDPSALLWHETVVPLPAPILPTRPTEVQKPIPPIPVNKPTAPIKIDKPTAPAKIKKPNRPESYNPELMARTESILGLDLTKRNTFSASPTVPVTVSREISLLESVTPTITVYDKDGKISTVLSSLDGLNSLPTEPDHSDRANDYTFLGYSTSPTEQLTLPSTLTENISLYPLYTANTKKYDVTFIVNGKKTVVSTTVGCLPSFDNIELSKPSDSEYDYTFDRWDKPLKLVWGEETYTAVYEKSDRIFEIKFVIGDKTVTQSYVRGSELSRAPIPTAEYVEGLYLYTFIGWDTPLSSATSDKTYTARYSKTALAVAENGEPTFTDTPSEYVLSGKGTVFDIAELLRLAGDKGKNVKIIFEDKNTEISLPSKTVALLSRRGAKYLTLLCEDGMGFTFTREDGAPVSASSDILFSFPHGYENDSNIFVRAFFEGGLHSDNTSAISKDGITSISAAPNVRYKTIRKFSVNITTNENGVAFTDALVFVEGEEIDLFVHPNANYNIGKITLKNESTGAEKEVTKGKKTKFVMPSSDVTLSVTYEPIEYTVTFVYHQNTESFKYIFGTEPTEPQIPLSFTEDDFFYTFIGWSVPVSVVTGNVTYIAKYYSLSKEEAPPPLVDDEENKPENPALNSIYKKLLVPAMIIAAIIIILIIIGFALLIALVIVPLFKKTLADPKKEKSVKKKKEKKK